MLHDGDYLWVKVILFFMENVFKIEYETRRELEVDKTRYKCHNSPVFACF